MNDTPASPRPGLAARAGRWSAAHRKTAIFGWLAFVLIAFTIGSAVGTQTLEDADTGSGESKRADQTLDKAFPEEPVSESVLIQSRDGTNKDAAFSAAVADVERRLEAQRDVATVEGPFERGNEGQLSRDGRSAFVEIEIAGDPDLAEDKVDAILATTAAAQRAHPDQRIEQVGQASLEKALSKRFEDDFQRAEVTSLPLTLLILLIAMGGIVAAGIPLLLGATAVFGTLGMVALASQIAPVDEAISSVVLLIGLAVGVDYTMFYLRREREEEAKGRGPEAALAAAAATSGRAVLISGLTVLIAMAGMFLAGNAVFSGFAIGTMLVVGMAMVGSITVLPAVLASAAPRWNGPPRGFVIKRIPGLRTFFWRVKETNEASRGWNAVLDPVLRHPVIAASAATALLLAMAIPALDLHTAETGDEDLPRDIPVMQTYDRYQAAFPGDFNAAEIAVSAPAANSPAMREALTELRRMAVASGQMFDPIEAEVAPGGEVARVSVPLQGKGTDEKSEEALATLREEIIPATFGKLDGVTADVTGFTAGSKDFDDQMRSNAPYVFAFVCAMAFLLLLATFRSIVIAIKAIVLNLLSVAAAYGLLVAVFQWGWGEGLLGFESNGGIVAWLPIFLFVILFGLSMDYHVFILSRVREAFDSGMSTDRAVAHGIKSTASVVTAAAVVMVAVFAVFATLGFIDFKQMGVGLAAAILIDATIVRAVLLPATMKLLGDWNWYLPRWLEWLPRVTHEPVLDDEPATEERSARPRSPGREPLPAGTQG